MGFKSVQDTILGIKGDLSYIDFSNAIKAKTGVDIHPTTLQKYVAGKITPSIEALSTIAEYAGMEITEFFPNKQYLVGDAINKINQLFRDIDNNGVFNAEEAGRMSEKILKILNTTGLSGEFALNKSGGQPSLEYKTNEMENHAAVSDNIVNYKAPVNVKSLPIIGIVPAGMPILAEENIEGYMPLPSKFVKGENDFLLKVRGDSMEDVNISDGDLILVHQQPTAENGQTVIARINGEVTCKRFYKTNGKCILEPANAKYKPIDCNDIEIVGIVTKVIKDVF